MIRRVTCVIAIVDVLLSASGCRSSNPANFSMQRSKSCTVSSCAARTQQCADWTQNCYSDCDQIDEADLSLQCYEVCASHDCSCTPEQVNVRDQWGFTFTLPPSRDERLYQACLEAAVRDATCHEHTLDANCDTVGRVEDPRLTAVYACIANATCGSGVRGCLSGVPTGTLGDEYCAVRASCGSFDPQVEAELSCKHGEAAHIDALSGRMRREALAAARTCFSEVCSDVIPCMDGWLAAVTGSGISSGASPTSGAGGAGGGPGAGGAAGGPTSGAGGAAIDVAGAPGTGGAGGAWAGGAGGSSTGDNAGSPGFGGAGGQR